MSETTEKKIALTPLMKQYLDFKRKYPDALLLYRVGDFYETFGEDAIKASEILGITLTKRANGAASHIELAGFPHHAIDTYLPRLVRAGQRVAICDQVEDPKFAKGIVKRSVTELVTPGVSLNDNVLENKENNFLAGVYIRKEKIGVSFLDLSTGEFYTAEGDSEYVDRLLTHFSPKEILYEKACKEKYLNLFGNKYYSYGLDDWAFVESSAQEKVLQHLKVKSLKGFGVEQLSFGLTAAGALLFYLEITQHSQIGHINRISRIDEDQYVWIDKFTARNLELFNSPNEGAKTLIQTIDKTLSPMGGRMLRRCMSLPLKDVSAIQCRLNKVEFLMKDDSLLDQVSEQIKQVGDLERIAAKVAATKVSPRELVQLSLSLCSIKTLKSICLSIENIDFNEIGNRLELCERSVKEIQTKILAEPSNQINKGNVIAPGVDLELDDLRAIQKHGKDYLNAIVQREIEATGINSLKISFNNVFGYYIEVRNAHKDKVPETWIRKQTLVGAERYITEELKAYEEKILTAQEKILILESRLYADIVQNVSQEIPQIQADAFEVAQLDVIQSFATQANAHKYVRPDIHEGKHLIIKEGRHPVIEQILPPGETYVANDISLNTEQQQIIIITGPNMSGKSALLRQTALIVLMGQMGSFVPAAAASIGIVDKLFTRVGASDNISQGESTFMLEMQEAASILNNLSDRSLVLLDEIGRGTSTYDGISIAWSMVEFIHQNGNSRAKTLFATHYHELNEMEEYFPRVKNFNVSIKQVNEKIVFVRKLVPGGSEHSFGIHVAEMAGMPKAVIGRAKEVLKELEANAPGKSRDEKSIVSHMLTSESIAAAKAIDEAEAKALSDAIAAKENFEENEREKNSEQQAKQKKEAEQTEIQTSANSESAMQLSIFQLDDPVLTQIRDEIRDMDINNLTPLEALNKLNEIKKITGLK